MLRPCNLIPKYLTDKIKNAAYLPTSEAKAAAATAANAIPSKSGGTPGMRAVRASKSALSSLSFSTFGDSSCGDDDGRGNSSSTPRGQYMLHHDNKLTSSGTSTFLKTSKSCEGRLVARTIPKRYGEYDCHKPATRIDPTASIASLVEWQKEHKISDGIEDTDGGAGCLRPEEESSLSEDEDEVVVLDLYLLRKSFLDEEADNNQTSSQRELRVQALIGSYDLSRNMSSHARISTEDSTSISTDVSGTKGDGSFSDNIFHFHMNRSSKELMSRTLRRLELSATRKLQSLHPLPNGKKSDRGKEANLALINKVTSSKLILLDDELSNEVEESGDDCDGCNCSEVDLTGLSSSDILRSISSIGGCKRWGVALTVPAMILPWIINRDQGVDGGEDVNDSTSDSADESACSSVNFNALETVFIKITSNPPTVLEVQTFENFTAQNFVGVPIVVETTIIYATRAIVSWFVDENVVAHDSKSYIPAVEDIGKSVSILITPVRPEHNGGGCQEAYEFVNAVQPLPLMPIMKLREGWSRVDVVERDDGNNLRVLTYNILADLYAGRQLDQQLMYSHCDMKDLMRSRRMPMIIAEILSYKADIICLQEVDASIHDSLISPVLRTKGYQGFYSNKVTSQQEGCSMFWSTSVFEMARTEDMQEFPLRSLLTKDAPLDESEYFNAKSTVRDLVELERWESMNGIRQLLEAHDEVRRVYSESVGQILQVVRLSPKQSTPSEQSCSSKPDSIVVANTHLFYHPMAGHIRLLQAFAICHKLDQIRRTDPESPAPLLICGDFNSDPLSGAIRLITNRSVLPQENDCWKHLNIYTWECGDSDYMMDHGFIGNYDPDDTLSCCIEEDFVDAHCDEASIMESMSSDDSIDDISPPAVVLPSCFPTLVSGCLNLPSFTNYATDFVETLDYVFASEPSVQEPYGFRPKGEAPMPSEEEVKQYVAMPNKAMPSDHVALVCDFEWVKKEQ
eukprot:scaffold5591_cov148-Skeletonema_marinoi.AAC.10